MILNNDLSETSIATRQVRQLLGSVKKYYYVHTFGCQQNEADSEKISAMLEKMGYCAAETDDNADIVVVNTCAIRQHAEMKALSLLGKFRAKKKADPDFILGVVGCMAAEENVKNTLKSKFHYVSFTLEPNMLHKLPLAVYEYILNRKRTFVIGEDKGEVVEGISSLRRAKHKAWVSIMYGCNNFCTYCIVPYVRGRERSRESSIVIEECHRLINSGVKEITLLGQNVNSYSSDMDFPELLEAIALIEGDFIIRFMTSHPKDTSDKLIETMAKYSNKIAPYFHLPLQSGSNSVLKRMNRTYTGEHFISIVKKLRAAVPNIALSTDVIVGFPGETDEDFADTLNVLKIAEFDVAYAFLYSPREGTAAAKMADQVPEETKSQRIKKLFELQDKISYAKNLPYLDSSLRVLVDSVDERDGSVIYTGRTYTNKLVHFTACQGQVGEFVNVKINKIAAFDLIGSQEI